MGSPPTSAVISDGTNNGCDASDGTEERKIRFVDGIIVGRRSMGRKLAFAEIALNPRVSNNLNGDSIATGENETSDASLIKIIFLREKFLGLSMRSDDASLDEPFPTKMTSLPYGAGVVVQLGNRHVFPSNDGSVKKTEDTWQVSRWKMKEDPREVAEKSASLETKASPKEERSRGRQQVIMGSGAFSYSTYLKARGEAFEQANRHKMGLTKVKSSADNTRGIVDNTSNSESLVMNPASTMGSVPEASPTTSNSSESTIDSDFHNGGKHTKAKRAKIFSSWVLDTFFGIPMGTPGIGGLDGVVCQPCATHAENANEHYLQNTHVLDIAGGKGQLSLELVLQQMSFLSSSASQRADEEKEGEQYLGVTLPISHCTIIDPMVRKCDAKRRHSKLKRARSLVDWMQRQRQNQNQHASHTSADVVTTCNSDQMKSSSDVDSTVINHIATCFDAQSFPQLYSQCNKQVDSSQKSLELPVSHQQRHPATLLLLGLHPDQCTEDILDVALEYNLSVAIVPCCVYPDLFPSRWRVPRKGAAEIIDNTNESIQNEWNNCKSIPVRSYDDFLQYLMDKDDGLQMATLPFEGKNKVIYRKVS